MRAVLRFGLIAVIVLGAAVAKADRIRVAVQKTGTLAWELDVIKRHGIERKLDLIIDTLELASTEAGKVALKGGSVDLILSDWLWVARERSLGDTLVFYPASTALGAVMTPAQSSIRSVLDLKDKKLAIAGGPLDKSWLLLQAFALRAGIDLRKQAVIVYGAPPLLSQKALQGETDATLTYWNFCAELENRGFSRAIAMENVIRGLGAKGTRSSVTPSTAIGPAAIPPLSSDFSRQYHQAKEILAGSETEWQRLAPNLRLGDANAVAIHRQRYSEGVLRRPLTEEEADARALYLVLADIGGTQLVGAARALPPGTFYRPAAE
jgi:NitT/TauT family transport system substrate-binding protein